MKIMNSYFEVGVRYDKTMEDGVIRKVTGIGGCPRPLITKIIDQTKK